MESIACPNVEEYRCLGFNIDVIRDALLRQTKVKGYGAVCARCGRFTFHYGGNPVARIPIKQGGSKKAENCVILCDECYLTIGQDTTKEIPDSELQFFNG